MQAINPEMRDLQQQVTELRDRLAKAEGEIQQLNRTGSDNVKQTIWQFVIFTVTMGGLLIGALHYQTSALSREFSVRLEATDQKILALEKRLEQRIDQVEKNLNARFEDLKQEVRSRK
jgi:peptidoglycan hydrolase CwlO-like protein